eukprot:TRINITY_DN5731_c0_g1_i2.p1 TRINITY_DN5731_c0_g1~~TRINITY_DN5731_c0_g1_i2.p1  ORF type:complete len:286 (+),score=40.21 TRINITY_DN5731_c0_g1_i2:153-1010(+)
MCIRDRVSTQSTWGINNSEMNTDVLTQQKPKPNNSSDQTQPLLQNDELAEENLEKRKFSMWKILSNMSILITYLANMFSSFGICFLEPTLAPYLLDAFNIGQSESGYFFGILLMLFSLFGLLIGKIIVVHHDFRKAFILAGILTGALGNFLIGPVTIFQFIIGPMLGILILALIVLGCGYGMAFIPNMPEQMSILVVIYPKLDMKTIGDLGATLQNSSFSLGQFCGPIIGGFLDSGLGFPNAAGVLGLSMTALGIWYAVSLFFRKEVQLTPEQLKMISSAKAGGE